MLFEGRGGGFQRLLVVAGELGVGLFLARLRLGPGLGNARGRRFQAGRHVFQQPRLSLGLGGDVACGLGQRVAGRLLAGHGVGAGLLPFLAQRGGHGGQRAGPGGQAFLVARSQRGLQLRMRLAKRLQQGGGMLFKRGGRGGQGLAIVVGQLGAGLFLAGEGVGPLLRDAAGGRFHAGRHAFQQLGLHFGLGGDVAHGLGQGGADGVLAFGGLRARLFPFLAQRGAHGAQGLGPGRQALLVARSQFGLQGGVRLVQGAQQRGRMLFEAGRGGRQGLQIVASQFFAGLLLARQRLGPGLRHAARRLLQARGHAVQQRGRALLEGLGEVVQRGAQILGQGFTGALLSGQGLVPDAGDIAGGGLETRGQAFQLALHGLRHGVLERGGFARQAGHRRFHHRLQRGAGGARALRHAFLHGLLHDGREAGIGGFGLALEGILAGHVAVAQGLVLARHVAHHGLQLVDQGGHGLGLALHDFGLALQQLEGFLALVALRIHAQRGRGLAVQQLRGAHAFAAAQRGQQAQHGGARHAGDGGAEGEAQALDRRGQRGADGGQVGGAFERQAGAAQRHHHAQEGAQHAQQHQQADQVRRQRRSGQAGALALDAQARGVAQALGQLVQPGGQVAGRFGQG
ncbi:hypothetical protein LMG26858_06217 [Achromobacter anxifer]|uniref:Uncharacterized protein n=1 Tax=Achromobacter anxifer TaxID=1287737 RepID=A0A6S7EZ06_9BURK|nr:hypothetical protein LMG26858_06217 [Achromobacter anxifer]